jgi:general secretion pathway protein C
MSARIAAFFLWAAAAASLAYWGLRVGVAAPPLPASVQPVSTAMVLRGDVMRLFATPTADAVLPTEPALASRFKLVGVMAPRSEERGTGEGIALIAVDGKPPRPFRVGATIDDRLVLQAVARRGATLGPAQGLASVRLELPPLVPAATGSLPPAPSFSPNAVQPVPRPQPYSRQGTPDIEPAQQQMEAPEGQNIEPEFVPPPAPDPLAPQPSPDGGEPVDDPARRR